MKTKEKRINSAKTKVYVNHLFDLEEAIKITEQNLKSKDKENESTYPYNYGYLNKTIKMFLEENF